MIVLKVDGMTCETCATHVKQALQNVSGVRSAQVSWPEGTAQLVTAPGTSPTALIAAVTGLGHQATRSDAPLATTSGDLPENAREAPGGLHKRGSGSEQPLNMGYDRENTGAGN